MDYSQILSPPMGGLGRIVFCNHFRPVGMDDFLRRLDDRNDQQTESDEAKDVVMLRRYGLKTADQQHLEASAGTNHHVSTGTVV